VSLTITEKGYCQNVDGDLDTENPGVKHDVGNIGQPRTALGMLVAALDQRRREGRKSFTVLSCDNQPDNGHQVCGGGLEGGWLDWEGGWW
jgi:fructuronate reductase